MSRILFSAAFGLFATLWLATPGNALAYPFTSSAVAPATGINKASLQGEGECDVTAVYKTVNGMRTKVSEDDYTVTHDKTNRPIVTFRSLQSNCTIEVEGTTPVKPPKNKASHTFPLKLTKV